MGLADRDYMRSHPQDQRFSRRSEPPGTSTLKIVLFWLVIGFACYKAVTWWQQRQAPKPVAAKVAPQQTPPSPRTDSRLTGSLDPAFVAAAPAKRTEPQENAEHVTKCTVNGATTYSDGPCPGNAKVATVKIDRSQNISDSVRIAQPPSQQLPQQVAQADQPAPQIESPHLLKKQRCEFLDTQIKWVDARARQPLSAGEQDWLAARRKEYRDEQFRIPC